MNTALVDWQHEIISHLSGKRPLRPAVSRVTAVAYFFWDDDRINTEFYAIAAAFLVTRRLCGELPCVLVVNRKTPKIEVFCVDNGIRIIVDPTLTGGIKRLSLDCITKLHTYFDTDYVLTIQTDGFPLRRGLEPFIGPYDYIGAPWGKASWYTNLVFPYPRYCVGNGGLSLRSKRLCEMASDCYRRKYRLLPYSYALIDDVFYCKVLPRFEKACRTTMVYAPPEVAGRFAFESNRAFYAKGGEMPLGFHAAHGFEQVKKDFGDRIRSLFI